MLPPTLAPEPPVPVVRVAVVGNCAVLEEASVLVPPGLKRLSPNCASLERSTSTMRTLSLTCLMAAELTTSELTTSLENSPPSLAAASAQASVVTLPESSTRPSPASTWMSSRGNA